MLRVAQHDKYGVCAHDVQSPAPSLPSGWCIDSCAGMMRLDVMTAARGLGVVRVKADEDEL